MSDNAEEQQETQTMDVIYALLLAASPASNLDDSVRTILHDLALEFVNDHRSRPDSGR